jgi:hypothetical protein
LAEIGYQLTTSAAKHAIQRCWHFTANMYVEIAGAMRGVIVELLRSRFL